MDQQNYDEKYFDSLFDFYENFAGKLTDTAHKDLFSREYTSTNEQTNIQQSEDFSLYMREEKRDYETFEIELTNMYEEAKKIQTYSNATNPKYSPWYKVLCNLKQNFSEDNTLKIQFARDCEIREQLTNEQLSTSLENNASQFIFETPEQTAIQYTEEYSDCVREDHRSFPVVQHFIKEIMQGAWDEPESEEGHENVQGFFDQKAVNYALTTEIMNIQTLYFLNKKHPDEYFSFFISILNILVNFLKGAYKGLDQLCSSDIYKYSKFEELLGVLDTAILTEAFVNTEQESHTGIIKYHCKLKENTRYATGVSVEMGISPPNINNSKSLPEMIHYYIQKILFQQEMHKHLTINIYLTRGSFITKHVICIVQQFDKSQGIYFSASLPKSLQLDNEHYSGNNLNVCKTWKKLNKHENRIIPFHEDEVMRSHLSFVKCISNQEVDPDFPDATPENMKEDPLFQTFVKNYFISEFNFACYITIVNLQDERYPYHEDDLWKIYITYFPYYLAFFTPQKDTAYLIQSTKVGRSLILPQMHYFQKTNILFHYQIHFDQNHKQLIDMLTAIDYNNPGNIGLGYFAMMNRKKRRNPNREYEIDLQTPKGYYLNNIIPNKVLFKKLTIHKWNAVDYIRARIQVVVSTTLASRHDMQTFMQFRKSLQPTSGNSRVYPFRQYYSMYMQNFPHGIDYYRVYMTYWLEKLHLPLRDWSELDETNQRRSGRIRT